MDGGLNAGPLRDALALAALARDCASSGVARRALLLRGDRLARPLREGRHRQLIEEALEPLRRPTRARLFELPGEGVAAISPPPGEHLDTAAAALRSLLPEGEAERALLLLRLPEEAASLILAVEETMGLAAPEAVAEDAGPAPCLAEVEAAERALAQADISAHQRRAGLWLLPESGPARLLRHEVRVHLRDLAALLLPGRSLGADPVLGRRFRLAAERRLLAALARPEEARGLGDIALPLGLHSALSEEFFRFEGAMGPQGRRGLLVCLPAAEVLADPASAEGLRRLSAARGWELGLDMPGAAAMALLRHAPFGTWRVRHRPGWDSTAMEAALPAERDRVVLTGADGAAAIGWGWQRGITRFMGRVVGPA